MIRHCCCCQFGQVAFKDGDNSNSCRECHVAGGYPGFQRRNDPVTDHEAALEWLLREVTKIRVELKQLETKHR
jgi:hypothetical protein